MPFARLTRTAPDLAKTIILIIAIWFLLFGAVTFPGIAETNDPNSSRSSPAACAGVLHTARGPDGVGGGQNIILRHNFIVCDAPVNKLGGGCTGNINLIPNFQAINGALIERNLLGASPSFCTYGGENVSLEIPHSFNIIYRNNIFQRGRNRRCAAYGPVTGFNRAGAGNAWINNRWEDGAIVPGIKE